MTPSRNCVTFIEGWEGFSADAYLPTPDDVPTIGFGETGADIHLGMTWTLEYATTRFAARLANFGVAVDHLVAGHATTQNQFDALVSFAYNLGINSLAKSTLLKYHNAGLYNAAALQFLRWVHQGKTVLNGLVRRRAAEEALYLKA